MRQISECTPFIDLYASKKNQMKFPPANIWPGQIFAGGNLIFFRRIKIDKWSAFFKLIDISAIFFCGLKTQIWLNNWPSAYQILWTVTLIFVIIHNFNALECAITLTFFFIIINFCNQSTTWSPIDWIIRWVD